MATTDLTLSPETQRRLAEFVYPPPDAMGEADGQRATDDLNYIQSVKRGIEAAKQHACRPLREDLAAMRLRYDRLLEPLEAAEHHIKRALAGYHGAQERAAAAALQSALDAQAALAASEARRDALAVGLDQETASGMAETVGRMVRHDSEATMAPAPVPRTTVGIAGSATRVTTWDFEVVDLDAVPREYLVVNLALIRHAVRTGAREGAIPTIPGIRIFRRDTIVGRRR
jgi:hypothetical protein